MKTLFILGLLLTQSVFAASYVCESKELDDNGLHSMRFRISQKRPVQENGATWDLYLVGVTPSKGFRQIVYGSGNVNPKSGISLTFVKDGFVLGSARAELQKDGLYYGEASVSGVANKRTLEIVCNREE